MKKIIDELQKKYGVNKSYLARRLNMSAQTFRYAVTRDFLPQEKKALIQALNDIQCAIDNVLQSDYLK